MTRLFDASIGDIEQGAARSALTLTGASADPLDHIDPEEWAAYVESLASLDGLGVRERELAGWIDADSVSVDEVSQGRAA